MNSLLSSDKFLEGWRFADSPGTSFQPIKIIHFNAIVGKISPKVRPLIPKMEKVHTDPNNHNQSDLLKPRQNLRGQDCV